MRQGCVFSPRLFSCVLELAFGRWRRKVGTAGVDFEDGIRTLFDLRFADNFLNNIRGNKIFVGRTGHMFGRNGTTDERR